MGNLIGRPEWLTIRIFSSIARSADEHGRCPGPPDHLVVRLPIFAPGGCRRSVVQAGSSRDCGSIEACSGAGRSPADPERAARREARVPYSQPARFRWYQPGTGRSAALLQDLDAAEVRGRRRDVAGLNGGRRRVSLDGGSGSDGRDGRALVARLVIVGGRPAGWLSGDVTADGSPPGPGSARRAIGSSRFGSRSCLVGHDEGMDEAVEVAVRIPGRIDRSSPIRWSVTRSWGKL